jgi:hypothetical protein
VVCERREWDSNPRRLAPRSFSRAVHSSALPSLQRAHGRGNITRWRGGAAALTRLVSVEENYDGTPITPTSLVNFGDAVNFPLILGVILVVFGAATLTHLLVVSVGRRRREMGLLSRRLGS